VAGVITKPDLARKCYYAADYDFDSVGGMGKERLYVAKPLPPWAAQVQALRKDLNLSQAQFGRRLSYSPMTVSRWERGLQKPPSECLLKMAKLAGPRSRWPFWRTAGINPRDARAMLRHKR
jgi:DNA-binding XRE family transcriptional regulator